MTPYRNSRNDTPKTGLRHLAGSRSGLFSDGIPDSGLVVREICNPVSDFSVRPTYREVTACGGTFPDTVTYLRGSYTPIGPGSSATCAAQALHLPDSGTTFYPFSTRAAGSKSRRFRDLPILCSRSHHSRGFRDLPILRSRSSLSRGFQDLSHPPLSIFSLSQIPGSLPFSAPPSRAPGPTSWPS